MNPDDRKGDCNSCKRNELGVLVGSVCWNCARVKLPWMVPPKPARRDNAEVEPAEEPEMWTSPQSKELNILILGETGVGKSTWINAFQNFLLYDSLEDAEAGSLATIIPSRFTLINENFEEVVIRTGEDDNEVLEVGKSATQGTRIHQFNVDNIVIRLIDTPGIGDVRGIEQDAENFRNILETVGQLKELHGICILLKPNNMRLGLYFRFCIKELLRNLSRDACENIVFCMTNSKSTFFRPGETINALRVILDENKDVSLRLHQDTIYCFDSEPYRYLAAVKNNPPYKFSPTDREGFKRSWEKSMEETRRMLKHIRTRPPHQVRSLVSLYNAKSVVLKLVRPMSEVSRIIEIRKGQVEKERMRIQETEENIKELQKCLLTTRTEMEVIKLEYPKLVCSELKCINIVKVDEVGRNTADYFRTICHEKCTAKGGGEHAVGGFALMRCKMINFMGKCKTCGHSYKKHLQVFYESREYKKEVEDEKVREILEMNLSEREKKEEILEEKTRLVKEFEQELRFIYEASLRFACFIKMNSITTTNDAMEGYLRYLILEEENRSGRDSPSVKALQQNLEKYQRDKKILEDAMMENEEESREELSPSEIVETVNRLMGLRHSGRILREALDCIIKTSENVHNATVVHHAPPVPRPRGGGRRAVGPAMVENIRALFENE